MAKGHFLKAICSILTWICCRIHSITVRSLGRGQSVAAVAYEMCFAAFQDYHQNLRGKVYEVKPGGGALKASDSSF